MAQYTHHDFYSNFTASLKAGDLDLTKDVLANEISDFIVFDTDKIIKALNQSGIKVDKNNTDEDIVDLVIGNIASNEKMSKALAFIIADGNELLINNKGDKTKQLKTISTISDGITRIGKDISSNSSSFKESAMNQVVSKAAKRTEYNRIIWNKDKKGMSGGLALLITVSFIGAIITVIYYRQKRSVAQALPNMIMGGSTGEVSMVAPQVTPGVVVPPPVIEPIPLMPPPVVATTVIQ